MRNTVIKKIGTYQQFWNRKIMVKHFVQMKKFWVTKSVEIDLFDEEIYKVERLQNWLGEKILKSKNCSTKFYYVKKL